MPAPTLSLVRTARFPGFRALTWEGDLLYATRGYDLFRAQVDDASALEWRRVASYHPQLSRRLSVSNGLTARLFRDGFHALALLPSGAAVAAVPASIIALAPNDSEFRQTHAIARGTRPLHVTAAPNGTVYWGEYFDNAQRDEVHIYASTDAGSTWNVAYTFPRGAIRHVHNIVDDPWGNCLWILTGDYGDECRILRASYDLSQIDVVLQGRQQARAVAAIPTPDGLYFSSDTPLECNFIYKLDRHGSLSKLAPIDSSSIYGCRVGSNIFFSTMVEPSEVNRDRTVRLYGANIEQQQWRSLLSWKKDIWPMSLFQYGNAFLPDGNNSTRYVAITTVAVKEDDQSTALYECIP